MTENTRAGSPACTEACRAQATNLAGQVNALREVIRELVITSRPGTPPPARARAWKAAAAIIAIEDARNDPDFMERLAKVRERNG